MQNAHERFGTLEFTKHTKDTTTRVRVYIDRAVLEPPKEETVRPRSLDFYDRGRFGDRRPVGAVPRQRCFKSIFRASPA